MSAAAAALNPQHNLSLGPIGGERVKKEKERRFQMQTAGPPSPHCDFHSEARSFGPASRSVREILDPNKSRSVWQSPERPPAHRPAGSNPPPLMVGCV